MRIAIPAYVRPRLEGRLPADVEPRWYDGGPAAPAAVEGCEVGWIDVLGPPGTAAVIEAGKDLRWISTTFAGVNTWPLKRIAERGIVLTNGAGLNAIPVAEFAVLGALAMAKNLASIIHFQDRREWIPHAQGTAELFESKALVIGYGAIGREIGQRLKGFGVEVTGVRRTPGDEAGMIGPDDWRARLAEFDWIFLAAAATGETNRMIGADELERMKPSAVIVNIARGALIDQAALIAAVNARKIAGAFLDVTEPEPPAPDDPIWSTPNIVMTCHSSGRSQTRLAERGSQRFLENLERWRRGEPLQHRVNLELGY